MLKKFVAAACVCFACIAPAFASDKADVEAAIRLNLKYANTGNDAAFMATLLPSGVVIDEFAPFHWDGIGAWAKSFGAYNGQNGITGASTKILRFRHINVGGGHAYAIVDVVYSYKQNGVTRHEKGADLFVLAKTDAGWRFQSFAWASAAGVDGGADATAAVDTVRAELDGFNTGKIDFAKLPWKGIIDEFPAYSFAGATPVADWGAAFEKTGQTDTKIALAAPTHLSINGTDAYMVLPATITGKVKGKPVREHGDFVFTLTKANGAWQSHSWAWVLD